MQTMVDPELNINILNRHFIPQTTLIFLALCVLSYEIHSSIGELVFSDFLALRNEKEADIFVEESTTF